MRKLLKASAVTVCGIVTSVLTAVLVTLVHHWTGFNLFTLSFWVIVPVGALITGFLAASGYHLAAVRFHYKPSGMMLLGILGVAGATHVLIYYLEFATMVLDDGTRLRDALPFTSYLEIALTKAKYSLARRATRGGVEVGAFGYVVAGIHFLGFVFGGFCVWANLAAKDMCEKCQMYLKKLATRVHSFPSGDAFQSFHERLVAAAPGSDAYAKCLEEDHHVTVPTQGSARITFELLGCPVCEGQRVNESAEVHDGKDWKGVDEVERKLPVPEATSLMASFEIKKSA